MASAVLGARCCSRSSCHGRGCQAARPGRDTGSSRASAYRASPWPLERSCCLWRSWPRRWPSYRSPLRNGAGLPPWCCCWGSSPGSPMRCSVVRLRTVTASGSCSRNLPGADAGSQRRACGAGGVRHGRGSGPVGHRLGRDRSAAELVAVAAGIAAVVLGALALRLWQSNRDLRRHLDNARAELAAFPPGLPVGAPAPGFSLPNIDGETVTLDALRAAADRGAGLRLSRMRAMPTWSPSSPLAGDARE